MLVSVVGRSVSQCSWSVGQSVSVVGQVRSVSQCCWSSVSVVGQSVSVVGRSVSVVGQSVSVVGRSVSQLVSVLLVIV